MLLSERLNQFQRWNMTIDLPRTCRNDATVDDRCGN